MLVEATVVVAVLSAFAGVWFLGGDAQREALLALLKLPLRVPGLSAVLRGIAAAGKWFVWKWHPIVQLAYFALVFGVYGVFIVYGYPLLPNMYMAAYHKVIGLIVAGFCVVTFFLASFANPGIITPANAAAYERLFPYDEFLYVPGKVCETCGTPKVARSKHSRVTDRCVARFDHYCIWLANDVGERNYRWFLSFLIGNSIMLTYGAVAAASIIASECTKNALFSPETVFVNKGTGQRTGVTIPVLFQYFMFRMPQVVMVGVLCCIMGLVLIGFTVYHLLLAYTNVTTNETLKWGDAKDFRDEAVQLYKKKKEELLAAGGAKGAKAAAAAAEAAAALPAPPPMPDNAYDNGLLSNFKELYFPPALYGRAPGTYDHDAPALAGEALGRGYAVAGGAIGPPAGATAAKAAVAAAKAAAAAAKAAASPASSSSSSSSVGGGKQKGGKGKAGASPSAAAAAATAGESAPSPPAAAASSAPSSSPAAPAPSPSTAYVPTSAASRQLQGMTTALTNAAKALTAGPAPTSEAQAAAAACSAAVAAGAEPLTRLLSRPRVGVGVVLLCPAAHPGRVLIGKRLGSHGAGRWALPGGHQEGGESWALTAARETAEETGLSLSPHRFSRVAVTDDPMPAEGLHYVTIFMGAVLTPSEAKAIVNAEPDKCGGWEWRALADLDDGGPGGTRRLPVFIPLQHALASGEVHDFMAAYL